MFFRKLSQWFMVYCCCCNVFDNEAHLFSFTKVPHSFIWLLRHHHCCSVIWLCNFPRDLQSHSLMFYLSNRRIRPQKLLRLREKDPEHNWMDVGWGQYICFITPFPPADRFLPLLPPRAGTNKTSTTLSRYKYHHVHFHR